ncbi:MAG: hypothetical protein KDA59_08965, partial [Planctomycetales bacterium]|nr:hypothetical protein [Planctomycetales bacterium]
MAETKTIEKSPKSDVEPYVMQIQDVDPMETAEWLDSLDYVLASRGPERVKYLLMALEEKARREGVDVPIASTTPYINTIPAERQ